MEVIFRRFTKSNKARKWINPGFLIGPYLPLYGFGLCTLFLISRAGSLFVFSNHIVKDIFILVLMAISMTALELAAGLIFIKGMNVKLWDYSQERMNYKGIICLKFSVFWGILGAVYYFFIDPYILSALKWFVNNLAFSFVLGLFSGCHLIDFCYCANIVAKIKSFSEEHDVLIKYEELKQQIARINGELHEKRHFFLTFKSPVTLSEHIKKYIEKNRNFVKNSNSEFKEKIKQKIRQ